jgi:hypothetical protein
VKCNGTSSASETGRAPQGRCGVGLEQEHKPAHYSIERTRETGRFDRLVQKLYGADLRIARSLASRRHGLPISLDAHHLACRANNSGDQKTYIADAAAKVQNAHPFRDSRSTEDPLRNRLNDASLNRETPPLGI